MRVNAYAEHVHRKGEESSAKYESIGTNRKHDMSIL